MNFAGFGLREHGSAFEADLFFDNCIVRELQRIPRTMVFLRLSVYGRTMDALAPAGDEGRGKLR